MNDNPNDQNSDRDARIIAFRHNEKESAGDALNARPEARKSHIYNLSLDDLEEGFRSIVFWFAGLMMAGVAAMAGYPEGLESPSTDLHEAIMVSAFLLATGLYFVPFLELVDSRLTKAPHRRFVDVSLAGLVLAYLAAGTISRNHAYFDDVISGYLGSNPIQIWLAGAGISIVI